jgi:hypothetical protein
MACGSQPPFPASGVRGSCPVNRVWGHRALSANFLNKRYITMRGLPRRSNSLPTPIFVIASRFLAKQSPVCQASLTAWGLLRRKERSSQ